MTTLLTRARVLLFASGACALTYQVTWLRDLRLVFGASTAASGAVTAVFMGGMGVGGALLGRRADRAKNPLRLYARLELAVAGTAAASPLVLWLARSAYLAAGGEAALGATGAAVVRALLAALVLGPCTVLMGGTLPAAARAALRGEAAGRRDVGALYAANTFGAFFGAMLATFVLLEVLGARMTLLTACVVNALTGIAALRWSRTRPSTPAAPGRTGATGAEDPTTVETRPSWFAPFAAVASGATFMLMELVWYRMLAPILGGSSYTFGIILAIALLGIGAGGALYARTKIAATMVVFAMVCALEAAAIALPYALGDRIAIFALLARPLGSAGFVSSVAVWTVVCGMVVLPGAIIAGIQYPLVIALHGEGRKRVGRDVGLTAFANTAGAVAGSIAGGFGLLPLLSAPGCWRLVVGILAGVAVVALAVDRRGAGPRPSRLPRAAPLFTASVAVLLVLVGGPTAAWRHSGIGAGRADGRVTRWSSWESDAFVQEERAAVAWEEDGTESSIALKHGSGGYSFLVNGKADGHFVIDAPTQVMSGLLAALLHPAPRRALVIGLGTGSTAGWLGAVPSMDRVDVLELERATLRVAREASSVNERVLDNPRVVVQLGDAREAVLTTRERYDIVFSEPSNPYRAGISSLYTKELYAAIASRLAPGGIFAQWLQAYDVDDRAVATTIVTLRSVFRDVSVWQPMNGDLLLLARQEQEPLDLDRMRARLAEEPYARAARAAYRTASVEGILAHHVASPILADAFLERGFGVVNLDDRNVLEHAFARGIGRHSDPVDGALRALATQQQAGLARTKGQLDLLALVEERWLFQLLEKQPLDPSPESAPDDVRAFGVAMSTFRTDRRAAFLAWRELGREPRFHLEKLLVAHGAASAGAPEAAALIDRVERSAERELLHALRIARTPHDPSVPAEQGPVVDALDRGFRAMRDDPWVTTAVIEDALFVAIQTARIDLARAPSLFAVLAEPFAAGVAHEERLVSRAQIGRIIGAPACVEALRALEPSPRELRLLELRARCYRDASDPRATTADEDLTRMREHAPFGAAPR